MRGFVKGPEPLNTPPEPQTLPLVAQGFPRHLSSLEPLEPLEPLENNQIINKKETEKRKIVNSDSIGVYRKTSDSSGSVAQDDVTPSHTDTYPESLDFGSSGSAAQEPLAQTFGEEVCIHEHVDDIGRCNDCGDALAPTEEPSTLRVGPTHDLPHITYVTEPAQLERSSRS